MSNEEKLGKWLVEHQGQAQWHTISKGDSEQGVIVKHGGSRISLRGWYPNGREYGWWLYCSKKKPCGEALLLGWVALADYLDNLPKPTEEAPHAD